MDQEIRDEYEQNKGNSNNPLYHQRNTAPSEEFSDTVSRILVAAEEWRRSLGKTATVEDVVAGPQQHLEQTILPLLADLERWTDDYNTASSVRAGVGGESAAGNNNHTLHADLLQAAQRKALDVTTEALEWIINISNSNSSVAVSEPTHQEIPNPELLETVCRDWQGAVARHTELALVLTARHHARFPAASNDSNNNNTPSIAIKELDRLVDAYVEYQRETFRRRVTPAVAQLKQLRMKSGGGILGRLTNAHSADDALPLQQQQQQHHAPALSTVLGQALALQHPLISWYVNLLESSSLDAAAPLNNDDPIPAALRRLCRESVLILDDQAQKIVETLVAWFWEDRPIDPWIQKTDYTSGSNSNILERNELGQLDALVEEMAFGAQVLARYSQFIQSARAQFLEHEENNNNNGGIATSKSNNKNAIATAILPEWTWKYAMLERSLATTQWRYARSIAAPVSIVLGTNIQVPSVLEDAQYLSTRALERAASTTSLHAMGTVAHAIAHDVWSDECDDHGNGNGGQHGVFQALAQQEGCWPREEGADGAADDNNNKAGNYTDVNHDGGDGGDEPEQDFAAALLGALDEDLKKQPQTIIPTSAPNSSSAGPNFLTTLAMGGTERVEKLRLESLFCVLNGTHAATGACRSLVGILDSLLLESTTTTSSNSPDDDDDGNNDDGKPASSAEDEKAVAMIQLAREELFRYAQIYEQQLQEKIRESVAAWCGDPLDATSPHAGNSRKCLDALRGFFLRENFEIDAELIQQLEADDRLEQDMLHPVKSSQFVSRLADCCEPEVLAQTGLCLTERVVDIVLQSLHDKRITEWGAILLAKESQVLQSNVMPLLMPPVLEGGLPPPPRPEVVQTWERLSQTMTVLQLETPDDWLIYAATATALTADELQKVFSRRVEFKPEAIQKVMDAVKANADKG